MRRSPPTWRGREVSAFLSQSGALCTAILDWSLKENVGFSAFVSLGSMLDVGLGRSDRLSRRRSAHQEHRHLHGIDWRCARVSFCRARGCADQADHRDQSGRTDEAAKAAASHTGSLTGSDEVLHAAFRRVGVLRVDTIAELFDMAEVLAKQPRPQGPRLAIVTNAGGPGGIGDRHAGDRRRQVGSTFLRITRRPQWVSPGRMEPQQSRSTSSATPVRKLTRKAIDIAAKDPNNDGLLVILTPQAMTDATATATEMKNHCADRR